jgi:hypothetical protein
VNRFVVCSLCLSVSKSCFLEFGSRGPCSRCIVRFIKWSSGCLAWQYLVPRCALCALALFSLPHSLTSCQTGGVCGGWWCVCPSCEQAPDEEVVRRLGGGRGLRDGQGRERDGAEALSLDDPRTRHRCRRDHRAADGLDPSQGVRSTVHSVALGVAKLCVTLESLQKALQTSGLIFKFSPNSASDRGFSIMCLVPLPWSPPEFLVKPYFVDQI